MLATVALLACFAVVVMPSLFTVAPNRRAGLPSPSDSAPQAAVSPPVERKKNSRGRTHRMHSQVFLRRGVLLGVVTTAALAALLPARAQVGEPKPAPAPQTSSATPACAVSAAQVRLNQPLPRLARRLANCMPIKIGPRGSSSPRGAGAGTSAASYPPRRAEELVRRSPAHDITVLSRGVNGDDANAMLARLDTAVIAEKPNLVLW